MPDALPLLAPATGNARSDLLLGLSGGLDSTALLHRLARDARLDNGRLRALHVHHGLHADADGWAAHCQWTCEALGIPLAVIRVAVEHRGEGLEAAAREARYAAFADALRDGELLVTAHHLDDQAETFLLRALRASGPDGLAAMRPWRAFARGWHWRPLLETPRAALLDYARRHRLQWIDDPANASLDFDRNFLRRQVMPLLRARWPQADAAFARSAALSAQASELLDTEDEAALASCATLDAHAIAVAPLLALPAARRARALRRWIQRLDLPPLPGQAIARIESDLLSARGDGEPVFRWGQAQLRRWRDLLYAARVVPPLTQDWQAGWDGRGRLLLPDGGALSLQGADALPAAAWVTARRGGERIRLPGRAHSHALKKVLQDLGVPPWERERLPLLRDAAGDVLAAGDLVHAAGFDAWLRANGARLAWSRAG